jgi:hypothetical protein
MWDHFVSGRVPVVGSSMKMTEGLPILEMATDKRLCRKEVRSSRNKNEGGKNTFIPPENEDAGLFLTYARLT